MQKAMYVDRISHSPALPLPHSPCIPQPSRKVFSPTMTRERFAWIVSTVLLAILAFQLPGTLAERDDDAAWVKTVVEVHRLVDENYVEAVDDSDMKVKSIQGMLSDLDPFTVYVPPAKQASFDSLIGGNYDGVGITLRGEANGDVFVVSPVEGGPADQAGIDAGDQIIKVDGTPTKGLSIDEVSRRILGPADTKVTLTVLRFGQQLDFTMTRQQIVLPTVLGFERNPDDSWKFFVSENPKVAYLRITQFDGNTFDELHDFLAGQSGLLSQGMQGLILDLRFNGGGRFDIAVKILNMFIKDGVLVSTKGRNRPETIERADGNGTLPDFPMIVLVNDESASASEIVSGSLQDNHRAEVVGQRTYGKGSVQELIPLQDDGGELKLTVAYYYLPSGRLVHRKPGATDWGVDPQIVVNMDQNAEAVLEDDLDSRNIIRRPATRPTTTPATRPNDPQFDTALRTIIGTIVLNKSTPATTGP